VFPLIYCIFAYQGSQLFCYVLEYPGDALITKSGRPKIVDTPLRFIFRVQQAGCHCWFCPQSLPISHWWMTATNQNLDYPRCKAKNYWNSIDAHSQNGVVTILASLVRIQATNTSVMPNSDQITIQLPYLQDQRFLPLLWCSFSEWGSDHVAVSVAYNCWQYIGYP